MKSPCNFDGKPIGAAMDAKSPFHAGVTMGPDQVERLEALRRARNRALKAESKARHRANVAASTARPQEKQDRERQEHKRRRNRADNILRALRRGTKVKNVADYWRITQDEVLSEVKWLADHRNRHRARHRKQSNTPTPRGLPPRNRTADSDSGGSL